MSSAWTVLSLLSSVSSVASVASRQAGAITYRVPASLPSDASPPLGVQPIGVSIEFFAFPEYMQRIPSTLQCLSNLADVGGAWPPLRIGGTTQDRARYDPAASADVAYSVSNSADAPQSLTFGPKFLALAGSYKGRVTIGLNRRMNNLANTIQAAAEAKTAIPNLYSIELGNEPNFFNEGDPIDVDGGPWTVAKDSTSQRDWQAFVGAKLGTDSIFSAGVYFGTSSFDTSNLVQNEGSSLRYVKAFSTHNYAQGGNGNLAALMSHRGIASQISQYKSQIAAARRAGKDFVMGETNSAAQGGGGISPTFGAALWVMDYSLQLLYLGTKAINFHHGTPGNCQYCWWGKFSMGAPYYGAYFASLALQGADRMAPLDDFTSNYGGYTFFKNNLLLRVLLYNSDFYAGGPRPSKAFVLSGLGPGTFSAKRLTASSATARQDRGTWPNISGETFQDGTCRMRGTSRPESITVSRTGQATVHVAASEALLIELF